VCLKVLYLHAVGVVVGNVQAVHFICFILVINKRSILSGAALDNVRILKRKRHSKIHKYTKVVLS